MNYISVKQAAEKFNLSERRIQRLCETKRIDGCVMVSGIWLIPTDAKKPVDERISEIPNTSVYLSLKDLCGILSISTATGRNWIKLGKLMPEYTSKNVPYFTPEYVEILKNDLQSGKNKALKSRRNKKYVTGCSLYTSYVSDECQNITPLQEILAQISENEITLNINIAQYIIADCALHFFAQKYNYTYKGETHLLHKYLKGELLLDDYKVLIDALIDNVNQAIQFCEAYPFLFDYRYVYEPNEDMLGLIYISLKNIGSRKVTGSYYTPTKIVKKLIAQLELSSSDKILDPCCGTGNFLLQLPTTIPFEKIYGNDIDDISVKITRINMALKFNNLSVAAIIEHITNRNYLTDYDAKDFTHIIGNPPWGYDFSENEKKELKTTYITAIGTSIESYDVFIECALSRLATNGHLSFILPEAILNVKAHIDIRKIIMTTSSIKYIEYLGNAFDAVQCPCIIFQVQNTKMPLTTIGMTVKTPSRLIKISLERKVSSDTFSFLTTDEEYKVLDKIKTISTAKFLKNNADFALGIVTGNNKEYISKTKTSKNEMILKGSDINKYHFNPSDNYIIYEPDRFQQVAPTEMYRAPEKLLYRFISNQLVFAYDNKQTLSLNSCNIVIPKLEDANIKYILAILNSSVAQFIYKMDFNSVKVLKSHIESIPIPIVDKEHQNNIIHLTNALINGLPLDDAQKIYSQLDQLIFDLFGLTPAEQRLIVSSVESKIF